MMPIQRQNEGYGVFDSGPRYAKDYETKDLPAGLVNALSRGVGITAGLNDPRRMDREAAEEGGYEGPDLGSMYNATSPTPATSPSPSPITDGIGNMMTSTDGYSGTDPGGMGTVFQSIPSADGRPGTSFAPAVASRHHADAYHVPSSGYGAGPRGGDFGRDGGPAVPDSYWADDERAEREHFDRLSEPQMPGEHEIPESHMAPEGPPPSHDPAGFGWGGYDDYDPHSSENLPDFDEQFGPHTASFGEAHLGGPAPKTAAPVVAPQVVPGWIGHGYVPGHRISLPLPQGTFKGTVTHLDGQQVGIRWDDGQHSSEEPANLRPL